MTNMQFTLAAAPEPADAERGRLLFAGPCDFLKGVVAMDGMPPSDRMEVCFAGRSNVGKSSLINALVNRKHLVKTSSTPGRTQLINFFDINQRMSFVDLPGYGYAKVPVAVRKKWGPMIETYLSNRETLKGVVVIMDIRRIPRQEELNLLGWLNHYALAGILVLTKTDKLSRNQQSRQQHLIARSLGRPETDFILFSAKTRRGRDRLWNAILSLAEIEGPESPD
jgi:GTP-binding protein